MTARRPTLGVSGLSLSMPYVLMQGFWRFQRAPAARRSSAWWWQELRPFPGLDACPGEVPRDCLSLVASPTKRTPFTGARYRLRGQLVECLGAGARDVTVRLGGAAGHRGPTAFLHVLALLPAVGLLQRRQARWRVGGLLKLGHAYRGERR